MDITEIIVALIGLLATIVTSLLVPLLKQKLGEAKFARMEKILSVAVGAAEQLGYAKTGEEKFQEALKIANDLAKKNGLSFDPDEVTATLESIVLGLPHKPPEYTSVEITD